MTREEAIKIFQDKLHTMEHGAVCCNYGIDKDAFTLAIQALEQEDVVTISEIPKDYIYDTDTRDFLVYRNKYTGDEMHIKRPTSLYILDQDLCSACVNREAVHRQINDWRASEDSRTSLLSLHKRIDTLPIITSKPKDGHWIKEKSLHGWDGKSYQCSVCGRSIHIDPEVEDLTDYPYCHCGAIMIDRQEGEIDE